MPTDQFGVKSMVGNAQVEPQKQAKQYIGFRLSEHRRAALVGQQLKEVLNLSPGDIVPIPDMPSAVMGIGSWHGDVLWLVDLGYFLGLPPLAPRRLSRPRYSVMIVHHQDQTLGLVVDQIEQIIWCDPDETPTPALELEQPLAKFSQGYCRQGDQPWLILDIDSIIETLMTK